MMTIARSAAGVCLALALASAALQPAAAQSRRELDARLEAAEILLRQYETRLGELEQHVLTGDPAAARMQVRIDELEQQLLSLNGQLEVARNENRQLAEELSLLRRRLELSGTIEPGADAYFSDTISGGVASGGFGGPTSLGGGDLDATAESVLDAARETGAALTPPLSPTARASGTLGDTHTVVLPDDPEAALDLATQLLIDSRFEQAEEAFAQFVARFPDHELAGEALYWAGETHAVRGAFADAADAYIESLTRFPDGDKAPDAMIGLASSLASMGQSEEACGTLDAFDVQYPRADAALRRKADRARAAAGCR